MRQKRMARISDGRNTTLNLLKACGLRTKLAGLSIPSPLLGSQIRTILRERYSTRFESCGIRVYLVRCECDLHMGWETFNESLEILQRHGRFWWERIPSLVQYFMLTDAVSTPAYHRVDGCCAVNPWHMREAINIPRDEAIYLAGTMVHAVCGAYLLSGARGLLGRRFAKRICLRVATRFLEGCLPLSTGSSIQAVINLWRQEYGRN